MADWGTNVVAGDGPSLAFRSRRSPVLATRGCVASSQPLATAAGLHVLRALGGNAADAAVAVAAVLAVVEPCSTGLGGDMFALHYDAARRKVEATNGSGRAPAGLTLDVLRRDVPKEDGEGGSGGIDQDAFRTSAHAVTVPGAAAGWEDFLNRHGSGRLSLAELLEAAADLAEGGFPVSPVTAHFWSRGMGLISRWSEASGMTEVPLSPDGSGRGPEPGELVRNPDLARVLRDLGRLGAREGFYGGRTGRTIADAVQRCGGALTEEDLQGHRTDFPDAISARYRDVRLWQVPPNGQGIAGLIALRGLGALEEAGRIGRIEGEEGLAPSSAQTMHAMVEMMRLGLADARAFVCDPDAGANAGGRAGGVGGTEWLLDEERISGRAVGLFDPGEAVVQGEADPASGTVSFQVVDGEGNAVSFVNSNFMGFGTGIVPDGCGFTLQNRGYGFSLDPGHPNALEPRKRPYHTIIPGILTHCDTGELYATLSNMGGYMQPQGHMQLTVDLVAGGVDPQCAVDLPRFCIADGTRSGVAMIEEGVSEEVVKELEGMGHSIQSGISSFSRSVFGRAQIIKRDRESGVLWAGSDGRADGCAMGY